MLHEALNTRLFNFNDITLLIVVFQYLMLALMLFLLRNKLSKANYFLVFLLLCNAFHSIDTLMIWSDELRPLIIKNQPNLLFWGSLGFWLQGPLLYWYVSSVLYKDFSLKPKALVHFIPIIIVAILLLNQYYLLPENQQQEKMQDLSFLFSPFMDITLILRYLTVILYGSWCLIEISHYRKQVLNHHANIDISDRKWLTWIVAGIVIFSLWALMVHLIGHKIPYDFASSLGLISNYFAFIYVNSLVFASLSYAQQFEGINSSTKVSKQTTIKDTALSSDDVELLNSFMVNDKPYLSDEINLSYLAEQLSLSESKLSLIINQYYKKNFSEFINSYRVCEAKKILADQNNNHKSILDILSEAGFSSKSNFNNVFKQQVGTTPTEYRKNILNTSI